MPDVKKYTETTEVETETRNDSDSTGDSESKEKKTTVKTERTIEKDRDPIIIVEEK